MDSRDRCDRCPVAIGPPCCGPALGLCPRARAPEWDAHLIARSALPCAPALPSATRRRAVADQVEALQLMAACDYRRKAQCGCTELWRCDLGQGRDGEVTRADCLACVGLPPAPPR